MPHLSPIIIVGNYNSVIAVTKESDQLTTFSGLYNKANHRFVRGYCAKTYNIPLAYNKLKTPFWNFSA
jgi:hypothetical protein